MSEAVKPPLGVTPAWLWREQNPVARWVEVFSRVQDVARAIDRYKAAGREPDPLWEAELEHVRTAPFVGGWDDPFPYDFPPAAGTPHVVGGEA